MYFKHELKEKKTKKSVAFIYTLVISPGCGF